MFNVAWALGSPAHNGGQTVKVLWPGVSGDMPKGNELFSRFSSVEAPPSRMTLAPKGSRRYTRRGLVTIQVFVPVSLPNHLTIARKLAIIARDAYEGVGTAEGLWFRGARIAELGRSESWTQINITTDYEYDEVR